MTDPTWQPIETATSSWTRHDENPHWTAAEVLS